MVHELLFDAVLLRSGRRRAVNPLCATNPNQAVPRNTTVSRLWTRNGKAAVATVRKAPRGIPDGNRHPGPATILDG